MTPIVISQIGGACPFQACGTFYGAPFYFRARGGEWSIEVARPGEDPVRNPALYGDVGDDDSYGYMKTQDAMGLIGAAFTAFTDKYAKKVYGGKAFPTTEETKDAAP